VLGHVQRGGSPTVYDRIMAFKFAVAAIDALSAGKTNQVIVFRDGTFGNIAIGEIADIKHRVDANLIELCEGLSR